MLNAKAKCNKIKMHSLSLRNWKANNERAF